MDITALFKASVKTMRLKNKFLQPLDKNRILLKKQSKDEFTIKTKDISYQLTQLRNLLLENRSAYMRFAYHLKGSAQMTDSERDIIDNESEKIINICTQFINDLKIEYQNKTNIPKQFKQHMNVVLDLLNDYLKAIFNIYNEQKAYRIQHELDTYKLLKLESNKRLIPIMPAKECIKKKILIEFTDNDEDDDVINIGKKEHKNLLHVDGIDVDDDTDIDNCVDKKHNKFSEKMNIDENLANKYALQQDEEDELEISPEDIQMFESENKHLYNELKGLSEEVQQIERNVVDIAKLQDLFSEKVTLQKADIERIASTVVGATENVKDANEQIKQAIQRNAGLRVYALFFLLIMSLTLLFLDWYND